MISLDDAFKKFKSRLELNQREQDNAIKRHTEVRDLIRTHFSIEGDILTGSYKRHTKTKPLKDIDIFFPLVGDDAAYRDGEPHKVLAAFSDVLVGQYGEKCVKLQRRSVSVDFGIYIDAEENTDYRVVSVDVVPAVLTNDYYEIPDSDTGSWVKTNPRIHEQKAIDAQRAFNNEWKAMVRMLKYWNNHHGKPVKPSFLLEVMALECLNGPFGGRWDYEFQALFATLADRIYDTWEDPARLGPPVSDMMTDDRKLEARLALQKAQADVTNAIQLAKQGKNQEALKAWRTLFGPKFPLS